MRARQKDAMITKSLNSLKAAIPAAMALFLAAPLHAQEARTEGGISEGGGRSVVCRNPAGEITSAQMLDLYEGEKVYKLSVPRSDAPMEEQIAKALGKLSEKARLPIQFQAGFIREKMSLLPEDVKLPLLEDSREFALPRNCEVEQLAIYYSMDNIQVDGQIWSKLSETDRAALLVHEAIYLYDRNGGATTSRRSRRIVANLFSDAALVLEDPTAGAPKGAIQCFGYTEAKTHGTAFYAFREGPYVKLQFYTLGGRLSYSKKVVTILASSLGIETVGRVQDGEPFVFIERGLDQEDTSSAAYTSVESSFEQGDLITVGVERVAAPQGAPFTLRKFYIEGTFGWDPQQPFPRIYFNCSDGNRIIP